MKKGRLSREKVLAAAVQVMDRDGLKTLSMRRLGVELGVEAMSLYRYVANKSALLDGIFETILGELEAPVGSGDWRTDVRHTARQFRAVLEAHPNAVLLFATRPAVTPASLDFVEASLAILIDAGFSPHNAMTAFQTVLAYIIGFCAEELADPDTLTTIRYDQLSTERYPHLSSLTSVLARLDMETEFERGLELLLDGLEHHRALHP